MLFIFNCFMYIVFAILAEEIKVIWYHLTSAFYFLRMQM